MPRLSRIADLTCGVKRHLKPRKHPPNGVLIISAGGLGDTVLFSVVADRFAEMADAGEPITVLLRKDGSKTAFCLPPHISVKTVDFGQFASSFAYRSEILDEFYQANFRLVIHTDYLRHPHLDEALVAAAQTDAVAMLPRSWPKYDSKLFRNRIFYSRLFDSGADRRDKIERWTAFANWLSGKNTAPPVVHLDDLRNRFAAEKDHADTREIIVQPFSAVGAKQVHPDCFQKLADALPNDVTLRLTGVQSDLDNNPEYKKIISKQNVIFDSSTFEEICPKLISATLVVSVDTAMMHLATAIGAPTLCLASAAYVGEIVPYAENVRPKNVSFLFENMDCAGCLGACIHDLADGRYPCIDRLTPDRVVSAVLDRLNPS